MIVEKTRCFGCGSEAAEKTYRIDDKESVQLCETCYRKNMDGRITETVARGQHVYLICTKCGAIFHTKNIAPLGCRTLFYGELLGHFRKCMECDAQKHTLEDLRLATKEELAEARLQMLKVDKEDEQQAVAEYIQKNY